MIKTSIKPAPDITELVKTLTNKKASYIPVVELGIHPVIKEAVLGRNLIDIKDEVEFWYRMGYDYVKIQPGAQFNVIHSRNGLANNLDSSINFNWVNEGKGSISINTEFERFKFPAINDFDYSKFDTVRKLLPDGMGVIGQYGDIFTMTWELMGFETFSYALFENPSLIRAINEKVGELVVSMFETMVQYEQVNVLFYSDDIAFTNGLLVPPDVLDSYFFPWLKKIGNLAAEYNKPLIYHSDGVLYSIINRIKDCGVDALHPIEPKAMSLKELKEKVKNTLCLIGNVEVDTLARGTPEDVRKIVKNNIELFEGNTGYCVGSSNSIPQYVKVENYIAMNEAAKEYGKLVT
ncbi:MAG: nucleoside 2-deoxyribosyltransferase [Melioribacteraceae bacterium]|nr:nucleoside 2-deoxyribosyltransferase [Melioribacteraceae bacterium]